MGKLVFFFSPSEKHPARHHQWQQTSAEKAHEMPLQRGVDGH
jgi:hypothetical protein